MSVTNDIKFDECNVKSLAKSEISVPWEMSGIDVTFMRHQKKTFKIRTMRFLFYFVIKMLLLVRCNKKAIIKRNLVSFKNHLFFLITDTLDYFFMFYINELSK